MQTASGTVTESGGAGGFSSSISGTYVKDQANGTSHSYTATETVSSSNYLSVGASLVFSISSGHIKETDQLRVNTFAYHDEGSLTNAGLVGTYTSDVGSSGHDNWSVEQTGHQSLPFETLDFTASSEHIASWNNSSHEEGNSRNGQAFGLGSFERHRHSSSSDSGHSDAYHTTGTVLHAVSDVSTSNHDDYDAEGTVGFFGYNFDSFDVSQGSTANSTHTLTTNLGLSNESTEITVSSLSSSLTQTGSGTTGTWDSTRVFTSSVTINGSPGTPSQPSYTAHYWGDLSLASGQPAITSTTGGVTTGTWYGNLWYNLQIGFQITSQAIHGGVAAALDYAAQGWEAVKDATQQAWSAVSSAAGDVWNGVKWFAGQALGAVSEAMDLAGRLVTLLDKATTNENSVMKSDNPIGPATGWTSLIPLYGSGRNMINAAQQGRVGAVAWYGMQFVGDVFIVGSAIRWAANGIATVGGNLLGKEAAANAANFGGCFFAGTVVAAEFGLKPIETVEANDRVWACDLTTGEWKLCRVLETYKNDYVGDLVEVTVADARIESTYHHPFWVMEGVDLDNRPRPDHVVSATEPHATVPGRWVDAGDLQVGDVLLLQPDRRATVQALAVRQVFDTVYNFQVEELHNYAVGPHRVLVHNNAPLCMATAAPNNAKTLVLGEGMDAVKNAASGLRSEGVNAKWYQAWGKNFPTNRPMTSLELEAALARNERWIRQKVKEGYQFYDIGVDPTRSVRSLFYELERRILKELGVETIPLPR